MAAFTDVRADAANTVMSPTSATPIMSAAAVAEVRFGLRIAFSRAIRPVMPLNFWIGMPERAADRRRDDRAEDRDAEEDDAHAEAHVEQPAVAEQAEDQQRDAERA